VAALRTLVLAFLILAGSLGATLLAPAEEAAAAGGCQFVASVQNGTLNGYAVKRGLGFYACDYSGNNISLIVTLYQNGRMVDDTHMSTFSKATSVGTDWFYCYRGYTYQTKLNFGQNGRFGTAWSPIVSC
jgi:hypothetical protein